MKKDLRTERFYTCSVIQFAHFRNTEQINQTWLITKNLDKYNNHTTDMSGAHENKLPTKVFLDI
jgi:hypothetical protein